MSCINIYWQILFSNERKSYEKQSIARRQQNTATAETFKRAFKANNLMDSREINQNIDVQFVLEKIHMLAKLTVSNDSDRVKFIILSAIYMSGINELKFSAKS